MTLGLLTSFCYSQETNELTKKGNKVFIEFPNDESRTGETYFIQGLKDWGYWDIVKNENESHFIIVFNMKLGWRPSLFVTLKTRENKEFKKSKTYSTGPNILNGYNPVRYDVNSIVDKFFKTEFK